MVTQMWKLFALIVVFLLTQGCATLKNGTTQKVFIDSLPSQATFHMIDTEIHGTTPATVELKRSNSYVILVEKDGYKPKTWRLATYMDLIWLFDFLCWPTIIVDASTSAANVFHSPVFIILEKENQ